MSSACNSQKPKPPAQIDLKASLANDDAKDLQIETFIQEYDLDRTDTFSVGDLDGDGTKDFAITNPYSFFENNGKIDSQYINISFSCEIPAIKHYDGFNGLVADLGDLDNNGTDELIYYPDWYQSNSAGIYVYGYKENKWVLFAKTTIRRDVIDESADPISFLKSRVKKIDSKSFWLTEHCWKDTDIVDSVRRIEIE